MGSYVAPAVNTTSFTCPHCDTVAVQNWGAVVVGQPVEGLTVSRCAHCLEGSLFHQGDDGTWDLVFPRTSPAPPPNEDLPTEVRGDYLEAASILGDSPRGAAALLRLAVQKLCVHFGEPGKNVNDDVASLVKKGLSPLIQQALDTVRITGNEAVHPGEINLDDDRELALALFDFVNIIAEDRITTPRKVQEMYDRLPESKRQAVEKRDLRET